MLKLIKPACILLLVFTALTGIAYPLAVTGLAQGLFPSLANGSLLYNGKGVAIGSKLIGQNFTDPRYFWGRPSATAPYPYNAAASTGSNLGPSNPALLEAVKNRAETLKQATPGLQTAIPVDLLTSSASGLDPHITPAAAQLQIPRIAKIRGIPETQVQTLIQQNTETRNFGILGESRVNVLTLNIALDGTIK